MNSKTQDDSAESERDRWLAYELHDGLLQWVVGARMQVDAILSEEGIHDSHLEKPLTQVLNGLKNALEEGRELIGFLERHSLHDSGTLEDAIQRFCTAMQPEAERNQQQLVLTIHSERTPMLDEQTRWNLLRITQQAVRNAVQHAGPCVIEVRYTAQAREDVVDLEIRDDGNGFDMATLSRPTNHFGLASMRHRAKLIGAELDIDSQPAAGCTIRCRLDLTNLSQAHE